MPITHLKVSAVADEGDTTKVQPSDWNEAHVISNIPQSDIVGLVADLTAKQSISAKDQPNGYAGLDAGGLYPVENLSEAVALLSNLGALNDYIDDIVVPSIAAKPSNSAGANVVPKSDGTNLVASSISDNGTTVSTTKILTVGDGSVSTARQASFQQQVGQNWFAMYSGGVGAPTATNYSVSVTTSETTVNASSAVNLSINNSPKLTISNTNIVSAVPFLNQVSVAPKTQVVSPFTVTNALSGTRFTNEGATALVQLNLPTAVAGLTYVFYCADVDGIRIVANTGDDIRIAGSVSATAGRIDSTTIGSCVKLTAINAINWIAEYSTGTWVVT